VCSWGTRRGSSRTDWVSGKIEGVSDPGVRDAGMTRNEESCVYFWVTVMHRKPLPFLGYIFYRCIHKACIQMMMWTYPVLGDSLARCRIRGVRHQQWLLVWLRLGLCSSLLVGKESWRWRLWRLVPLSLSVCSKNSSQRACNGRKLLNSPELCNNLNPWLYYFSGMTLILSEMMNLYVIASDPGTITTIQGVGFALQDPGLF